MKLNTNRQAPSSLGLVAAALSFSAQAGKLFEGCLGVPAPFVHLISSTWSELQRRLQTLWLLF